MISASAQKTIRELSVHYRKKRAYFLLDILRCKICFGLNSEEYRRFSLQGRSTLMRRAYVSSAKRFAYVKRYNQTDDIRILQDKALFNASYQAFVRRPWLDCRKSDSQQIIAFLQKNPVCIQKPADLYKGMGISQIDRNAIQNLEAFAAPLVGTPVLLEAWIKQHPQLAQPNPSSVNTVRILALRDRMGEVHLPCAVLRVGLPGKVVDNFAAGGIVYPLEIDTGIITGPGVDHSQNSYVTHPGTSTVMPGMIVPEWKELRSFIASAMDVLPKVRYVGWDVAVTADGFEIIEGNHDATVELFQICEGQTGVDPFLHAWV